MVITTLPNISAGNFNKPQLNFLKTTAKELNGAAIRVIRRKMGDILLIKREKVSVKLKVNVITRKYKNYNYPATSVMFNNLAPTT